VPYENRFAFIFVPKRFREALSRPSEFLFSSNDSEKLTQDRLKESFFVEMGMRSFLKTG